MKKTPLKRKSNKPSKALRLKAWKVFAAWIKKRDGYKCVTCGKQMKKGDPTCHAGHFLHSNSLDFDERNINCQCAGCNTYRHGNQIEYTLYMQKKYGNDVIGELKSLKGKARKFSKDELEEIIAQYK